MSDIDTVAIRENFKFHRNRDLNMSDDVLTMVVEKAGKTWQAFGANEDAEGAVAFLEKAETEIAKVSISDPGISALVNKMDPEFHQAIAEDIEHVVKGKATAVHIYAQFKRIYTKEELDAMPEPGTEAEHVNGTNRRPDKVKTKDQTGKAITVVWTNDFVSAMPEGKQFETILDDVAKEVQSPNSVPAFKGKSKADLAAIKADATQRRNAIRSMVKRAIALHHQWEAVSAMPKIGLRWIKGTKDKGMSIPSQFGEGDFGKDAQVVTLSPKPIWIYPVDDPSEGRDFSVTQFLGFDATMALKGEGGGTMADLTATASRGSDKPPEGGGDGVDMPDDAAQATLSQFYNWFNKREHQALVLKKIANRKADADGNDWLDLIGSLYLVIAPIYNKNKTAYEELQSKPEADAA